MVACVLAACSSKEAGPVATSSAREPGPGDGPVADRVITSLFDAMPMCDVEHRGVLVDLGSAADGRVVVRGEDTPMQTVEHDGSTWSVATRRAIDVHFVLAEPTPVFGAIHVTPIGARHVELYLDDLPLGGGRLKSGEPTVVETSPTTLPVDAGEHVLGVRFSPTRAKDGFADVDWVRVGFPDDLKVMFGAPTADDVMQSDASLSKVPHRALSLRAPAVVRCPVRIPAGARLRTAVGMVGAGESDAEIAIRTDDAPPVALLRRTVKGGEDAKWDDFEASLDPFAGKIVDVELRAPSGSPSGRILFGDPEILVPTTAPPPTLEAQVVVLVVMDGVDRDVLPGYAPSDAPPLDQLSKFAERAARFENFRGATNVIPAAMATLFTGLPPEAHSLTDYGSRLPQSQITLLTAARSTGRQVAYFSAVPHSFAPSGLAHGATTFEFMSPVSGDAADPLTRAAEWVSTSLAHDPSSRLFVIVHARGGHPPWAIPAKQLDALPPENYTGDVSPRRAGEQLRHLRGRKTRRDLSDLDLTRLSALYRVALLDQDQKLGALMGAVTEAGLDEKTLFVVTGDVSSGLDTLFSDTPPLDERTLALPLYVAFPTGMFSGRAVPELTTAFDLSTTLRTAMGIPRPQVELGRDLKSVASGLAMTGDSPAVATAGDLASLRWGNLSMREQHARPASLCDVPADPTCAFDRRPLYPLAAAAFDRFLAAYDAKIAPLVKKGESEEIDDETLAALRVWGSMD